jgi:hypothetical protein
MSTTEITVAGTGQPAASPPSAAQLAARIQVPRSLPRRYDGQPLAHLSHSSYNRFALCPEDWRRRYMLGERVAPSGAMFLGRRVDDAITLYYRWILEHEEHLSLDQVKDAYRDGWRSDAEAERQQLGIAWEEELREEGAFRRLAWRTQFPPPGCRRRQRIRAGGRPGEAVGPLRPNIARSSASAWRPAHV